MTGSRGWRALKIFDEIVDGGRRRRRTHARPLDHAELGRPAQADHPLGDAIAFTESIIAEAREALGDDFWGFLMLGGMSGGGMAFFVAPHRHDEFQDQIAAIMKRGEVVARRRPAVRDGTGRLRLPDQPPRHARRRSTRRAMR